MRQDHLCPRMGTIKPLDSGHGFLFPFTSTRIRCPSGMPILFPKSQVSRCQSINNCLMTDEVSSPLWQLHPQFWHSNSGFQTALLCYSTLMMCPKAKCTSTKHYQSRLAAEEIAAQEASFTHHLNPQTLIVSMVIWEVNDNLSFSTTLNTYYYVHSV